MQENFDTDAARWQAVATRNTAADGIFFYGVRSTGIYCRPGCPARSPKRGNTVFFASTGDAEQAGYRACKRCRPNAVQPQADLAQRICRFIDGRLEQTVTLAALAAEVGLSPFHLQRVFRSVTGVTPRQYQQARRLQRLRDELRQGTSVTTATYAAGYSGGSRMYADAGGLGMKPAAYRKQGDGQAIRFTVFDADIGKVMVAATVRGLCRVALGDDAAQLEAELRQEFSRAEIVRDDAGMGCHSECIAAYLHGQGRRFDLPLDIRATAFQRRVWQLLQAIPYGETRSYSELAQQLGNPKAVRAVARACAGNPLALVIPCHRVVQKSGDLAGFRWGLERKAALLAAEKKRGG